MTHEQKAQSAWTYSEQDGPPGKCFAAQVWDENGGSIAVIDPTDDSAVATERARLFAATPQTAKERDGLRAENERLRATLEFARQLLECIEQAPNNVWYVNADDPESAITDTYSVVEKALRAQAGGG